MTKGHINLSDFQFYYKRKPYLCSIKTTISKWCTNCNQPDVESLIKIAKLLEVNINDILITD